MYLYHKFSFLYDCVKWFQVSLTWFIYVQLQRCSFLSHSRLRREDGVEDALPPVVVPEQEDILDNGGQAGFREGAVQPSLQERRPLPLQRPLAAHVALHTQPHVSRYSAS